MAHFEDADEDFEKWKAIVLPKDGSGLYRFDNPTRSFLERVVNWLVVRDIFFVVVEPYYGLADYLPNKIRNNLSKYTKSKLQKGNGQYVEFLDIVRNTRWNDPEEFMGRLWEMFSFELYRGVRDNDPQFTDNMKREWESLLKVFHQSRVSGFFSKLIAQGLSPIFSSQIWKTAPTWLAKKRRRRDLIESLFGSVGSILTRDEYMRTLAMQMRFGGLWFFRELTHEALLHASDTLADDFDSETKDGASFRLIKRFENDDRFKLLLFVKSDADVFTLIFDEDEAPFQMTSFTQFQKRIDRLKMVRGVYDHMVERYPRLDSQFRKRVYRLNETLISDTKEESDEDLVKHYTKKLQSYVSETSPYRGIKD